jgi:hypothetical protein
MCTLTDLKRGRWRTPMKTLVLLCIVFALALPGCGKSEDGDDGSSAEQAGTGAEKEKASGGVETPDGFPDDVYVYENASVAFSGKEGGDSYLTLRTPDAPDRVVTAYEQKAKEQGWKMTAEVNMESGGQRTFVKGDRQFSITVGAAGGRTNISIVAGSK